MVRRRCLDCKGFIPRGSRCGTCKEARRPAYSRTTLPNKIKKRDNYTCTRCGAVQGELRRDGTHVKVEAHHLIPVKHGGTHTPNNMTTLCDECHKIVTHAQKTGPYKRRRDA